VKLIRIKLATFAANKEIYGGAKFVFLAFPHTDLWNREFCKVEGDRENCFLPSRAVVNLFKFEG
jgi:hypothetical protein